MAKEGEHGFTQVAAAPPPQVHAAGAPNAATTVLAQGLDTLQQAITVGTALEELAEAIPLTGVSPTLAGGLDVLQAMRDTLGGLKSDADFLDELPANVADELEALDATVGGVTVTFGCADEPCDGAGEAPVTVVDSAGVLTLPLPLALTFDTRIVAGGGATWAPDEVIAGARKRVVTLLDRERSVAQLAAVSGGDAMVGNDGSDRMFGEGGPDSVKGNGDDDMLEGDQGSDWLEGNDGEDDIVGGSSFLATDGGLPLTGAGADLGDPDEVDAIFGGAGADVLAGDNAVVIRQTTSNSTAYQAALATAYFTSDPMDAVAGWWLAPATDRLVRLLDRSTVNTDRFGADLIAGGSGEDVLFAQDGNDWATGGVDDDAVEGNGGADSLYGDRAPTLTGVDAGEPAIPTPVVAGSAVAVRDGAPSVQGEDDIVGGSSTSHRDGNDLVEGDGDDDFVLGDNGTLRRNIRSGAYVAYPGVVGSRWMRRATRLDVAAPTTAVRGDDQLRGNAGNDAIWGQDGNDTIYGQQDDDDLFGELGDDTIYGGLGEDAMVGDRGAVTNTTLGNVGALFSAPQYTFNSNGPPFVVYTGFRPGTSIDASISPSSEPAPSAGRSSVRPRSTSPRAVWSRAAPTRCAAARGVTRCTGASVTTS